MHPKQKKQKCETVRRKAAFVLRIWWEDEINWRGWMQHVGSGEEVCVQDENALLDFIRRRAEIPSDKKQSEE